MNETQIDDFVRIASGEDIPVYYFDAKEENVFAEAYPPTSSFRFDYIYINKYYLKRSREVYVKMALLHEIGHVKGRDEKNTPAMSEYRAQMWAINRAKELGMRDVVREARRVIRFAWQKESKKYQEASKIYKSGRLMGEQNCKP